MLFEIRDGVLNGTEQVLGYLDSLLMRVEDEVHILEIIDADVLESSRWYQSSRPSRRKLLEEIAATTLYQSHPKHGVHSKRILVDTPESSFKAKQLANAPLQVILENDISDGALIRAAIHVFGSNAAKKLCFGPPSKLDPSPISFESGGGEGEVLKKVSQSIQRAQERARDVRAVVVADSDGEWVGDVKVHAVRIRNGCAEKGIPCPPLNKRSAENYIPDVIWKTLFSDAINDAAMGPVLGALFRLTSEQRDHIKMASGGASWNENDPAVAALFSNVSEKDKELLSKGNFKGKGESMRTLAMETHIGLVTAAHLLERDPNQDLLTVVQHIENEL